MEFVDDVSRIYLDLLGVTSHVKDMICFLSGCHELSRRNYNWNLFKMCCVCLGHVAPKMSHVALGSSKVGVTGIDLSCVIEPIQGYLLNCDSARNLFTDPDSISSCLELLETFCDKALRSDYSLWM